MSGALRVLCIGAPEARLQAALRSGASAVLNIESNDESARFEWVKGLTDGRGVDVTFEATGDPQAVAQAMQFTRDAGRVVIVGQYTDHGPVSFNPHSDLNRKHLDVRGCWGSDFSHFYRGAQIICDERRAKLWGGMELKKYGLRQTNEALDDVAKGRVLKALIDPSA